jgi:hypothetical protein
VTKIIRSKDCGNSPKNRFIEDLEIAFAKRDVEFLLNSVTNDVLRNIVGRESIRGMNDLSEALQRTAQTSEVTEITIYHVVTHGKAGSVNGTRKHKDGKTYDFCTVYEFSNAKGSSIKGITHYAIERA